MDQSIGSFAARTGRPHHDIIMAFNSARFSGMLSLLFLCATLWQISHPYEDHSDHQGIPEHCAECVLSVLSDASFQALSSAVDRGVQPPAATRHAAVVIPLYLLRAQARAPPFVSIPTETA